MIIARRTAPLLMAVLAAVPLLAACSSTTPQRVVTITVPPSGTASTGSSSTTGASSSGSAGASPSAGATASRSATLGGTCDSLLSDYQVSTAIGRATLPGTDLFVVGVPEADIGRLAYLNCKYAVTGTGATAAAGIEIGISLYATPQDAAQRVSSTVTDYSAHGAQATPTMVSGSTGQLLTGGTGAGYTQPLLVVASGPRTVAVTVAPSIATGAAVGTDAAKLAALALAQTGG